MAYTAGDTILDDEYNTFVTGDAAGSGTDGVANVNSVWATGSSDIGYGQSGALSAVTAGSTITATQWNNFLGRIESIAAHQGTSVTDYSTLSAGATIAALATVSTDLTNIYNNRNNASAVGAAISTTVARTSAWAGVSGPQTITATLTLTFADANSARYYFNSGGTVRFSFTRTGGTTSDKNSEWADTSTKVGTIWHSASDSHTVDSQALTGTTKVGGGSGGSGSAVSNVNYYDLTDSPQQLFKQFSDTSPYTANYIEVVGSVVGAVITYTCTAADEAADTANPTYPAGGSDPASLDVVNGTFTWTAEAYQPSTGTLTSTWGTPAWATTDTFE